MRNLFKKGSSITLSFFERFRVSDPLTYNLLEQNGLQSIIPKVFRISYPHKELCIILQKFRISDPQDFKRFKKSDCTVDNLSEQNSYIFIRLNGFRISDPPSQIRSHDRKKAVLFLVQNDFKGFKHFDPLMNNLLEQNVSSTCCEVFRSLGVLAAPSVGESVIRSAGARVHVIIIKIKLRLLEGSMDSKMIELRITSYVFITYVLFKIP